jgi:tRNA-Thr(GGU) m(6)t(6)A37 methyltransferase TsaA
MSNYTFSPIGYVHSCYKEKFGIPRQPALIKIPATIEIEPAYSNDDAFRELETFSHIWVIFVFHGINQVYDTNWKTMVRPPRLGGNKRVGVFASRSMFRPNPVGLSVVELESIERKDNKIILNIIGGDFLNQTPVLDIKPYIPYADSIDSAKGGYAVEQPESKLNVRFSELVLAQIADVESRYPSLKKIIQQVLQLDPRPAYLDNKDGNKNIKNEFGIKLYDFDIKWQVYNEEITVTELKKVK